MKNQKSSRVSRFLGLIALFALCTGQVFAAEGNRPHPCRELREAAKKACQASGKFEKGKHKEGKGLYMDCVKPLVHGKTVEGVTLDASLVKACQDNRAARKAKGAETGLTKPERS